MLNKIIVAALSLSFGIAQAKEKSIIQIGGIAAKMTKSTSCNRDDWGKSDENACRCCITKHNYTGDSNQKAFAYCSQKTHCTDESLHNIADKAGLRQDPIDPDAFVTTVVRDAHLLPVLTLNEKELVQAGTRAGDLNEKTVVYFLKVASEKNAIPTFKEELQRGEACIEAIKGKATAETPQLFTIRLKAQCQVEGEGDLKALKDKTIFILKETKKPVEESMNLAELRGDPRVSKYMIQKNPADFAIDLDSQSLVYTFKEQPHFMVLLKAPPGKSIADILKTWREETTKAIGLARGSDEGIEKAKNDVIVRTCQAGRALALFNQDTMDRKGAIFGQTIEHGALDSEHYFVIVISSQAQAQLLATMVNNESMAASLKQLKPVSDDLVSLTASSAAVMVDLSRAQPAAAKERWKELFFAPFIGCYAQVFPAVKLEEVKRELKKIFETSKVWDLMKAQGKSPREWSDIAKQMVDVINAIH